MRTSERGRALQEEDIPGASLGGCRGGGGGGGGGGGRTSSGYCIIVT